MLAEGTLPRKILEVANDLQNPDSPRFSAAELAVKTWQKFPKDFGLEGFEERHPDTNKVLSYLMGEKGLVKRGLMNRVGPKVYTMTEAGRDALKEKMGSPALRQAIQNAARRAAHLELMNAMLATAAYRKYERSRDSISSGEAFLFFGIKPDTPSVMVDQIYQGNLRTLREAADYDPTARILRSIHEALAERFARHLKSYGVKFPGKRKAGDR